MAEYQVIVVDDEELPGQEWAIVRTPTLHTLLVARRKVTDPAGWCQVIVEAWRSNQAFLDSSPTPVPVAV